MADYTSELDAVILSLQEKLSSLEENIASLGETDAGQGRSLCVAKYTSCQHPGRVGNGSGVYPGAGVVRYHQGIARQPFLLWIQTRRRRRYSGFHSRPGRFYHPGFPDRHHGLDEGKTESYRSLKHSYAIPHHPDINHLHQ